MGPVLVVVLVALVAVFWVRGARRRRTAWLERVGLPGTWIADSDGEAVTLELTGALDAGNYTETVAGSVERGRWRVAGGALVFTSATGEATCELRVFSEGRIGLDGPGRERRIYQRQQSNVVPLRRGQESP